MLGRRKAHVAKDAASVQAVVTGVRAHGGESGSRGLVYYDLDLRARFDDGSSHDFSARVGGPFGGTELRFIEGDIVPVRYDPRDRSKIVLDENAMNEDRVSRSDAFTAARIHGAEMELDNQAAAARATGAPTDAEQVQLGEQYKRLRRLRPDWEPDVTR